MGTYRSSSANRDATIQLPTLTSPRRRLDPRIRHWATAVIAGAAIWAAIITAYALAG